MTEREKLDLNKGDSATAAKRAKMEEPLISSTSGSGPQNLLSLWTNRISSLHSKRHVEFAGRLESKNNIAELYQHLNEENGVAMDTSTDNSKQQQNRIKV